MEAFACNCNTFSNTRKHLLCDYVLASPVGLSDLAKQGLEFVSSLKCNSIVMGPLKLLME